MAFLDKLKDKKDDFVDKAKENLRINKSKVISDFYNNIDAEEQYYEQDYSQQDIRKMVPDGADHAEQEYFEENYTESGNQSSYWHKEPSRPNLLTRQDIAQDTRRTEAARVQENDKRGVYATRGDKDLSLKEQKENRERRAKQYRDFSDFSFANIPSMRSAAPRFMNIITPVAYEDCERISASIRQGNITVLCFDDISHALYTRLLDFAFGAASIEGSNVDCLRPGLFVFVEGQALTDSELKELKSKGFLK
ncbi:MAG: cell division protein SepF [Eggerthellaceae bacterium]|nr:cell division protein SepF [Eggerthellaceae bacterium]